MDRHKLSQIDEELGSSDVDALRFLCLDFLKQKQIEGIEHARDLFVRLEEKGLSDKTFILQLLRTIQRLDLVRKLETETQQTVETDACRPLSNYRVMLYKIYKDMTEENLEKLKFLLNDKLPRRQMEKSRTALDVFSEMEKAELLSQTNLNGLHEYLLKFDQKLASLLKDYIDGAQLNLHASMDMDDNQTANNNKEPVLSMYKTESSSFGGTSICSNAQPSTKPYSPPNKVYAMVHVPRGLCVVISNETFTDQELKSRSGTQKDEDTVNALFIKFGFTVVLHRNLTANAMREEINKLAQRNFINEDALVVFVLSHGDKGCVFGSDGQKVSLRELRLPFTSVPTLAGKPKLFFIQACQGKNYQKGVLPCPPKPAQEGVQPELEEDCGPDFGENVPSQADFLIGMATVEDYMSFRHRTMGSIYIQELCKMLEESAQRMEPDDLLSILTRVNGEVSKRNYKNYKQMPEPKYTLTKNVVFTFVNMK